MLAAGFTMVEAGRKTCFARRRKVLLDGGALCNGDCAV